MNHHLMNSPTFPYWSLMPALLCFSVCWNFEAFCPVHWSLSIHLCHTTSSYRSYYCLIIVLLSVSMGHSLPFSSSNLFWLFLPFQFFIIFESVYKVLQKTKQKPIGIFFPPTFYYKKFQTYEKVERLLQWTPFMLTS